MLFIKPLLLSGVLLAVASLAYAMPEKNFLTGSIQSSASLIGLDETAMGGLQVIAVGLALMVLRLRAKGHGIGRE